MKFSVTPAQLAQAAASGATTQREAAVELVRAFVDTRLSALLKDVQAGKYSGALRIKVDESVTHNSAHHTYAIEQVAEGLRGAGYDARKKTEPAYDDGPNRSSCAYDYIEIQR